MDSSTPDRSAHPVQIRSRERVSARGEVFTADREVNAMLDLVKQETLRIDSRFLEPACGNGNFLIRILERKLAVVTQRYGRSRSDFELSALIAVSSLYGVDILQDNVLECRQRLYDRFVREYEQNFPETSSEEYFRSVRYVFRRNILWGDALTLKIPDGSAPIIFSEWSALRGKIKRRDFTLDELLRTQPYEGPNLFSDLGDEAFIPKAVREYPLTSYLKLYTYEDQQL